MISIINILLRTLLIIPFFCLFSCGQTHEEKTEKAMDDVNQLLKTLQDSLYVNPSYTRRIIQDKQKEQKDSLSFYKLQSYLSVCYYLDNQIESAVYHIRKAIHFIENNPEVEPSRLTDLKAHAYNYMGLFMQENNERDSTIHYFQKAIEALKQTDDKDNLPGILINLADIFNTSGNFISAIDHYRQALTVADSLQNENIKHSIYAGLAQIYTNLRNFSQADYYYQLAGTDMESRSVYEKFFFYNSRGNHFYQAKRYSEAIPYFRKAGQEADQMNHPLYRSMIDSNLGETFLLLNEADSAQYYLDRASDYFMNSSPNSSMVFYFNSVYGSLALLNNDLEKAEKYLFFPFNISEISPNYLYLHNQRLEDLYALKKDYKQAYEYSKQVKLFADSLQNTEVKNNIAEIDFRYRQDTTLLKKDILLSEQEQEISQLHNYRMILFLILLVVILIIVISVLYIKKKQNEQQAQRLVAMTRLRMENMRNRIFPHYLFNILNVLVPAIREYDELAHPVDLLISSIRSNLLVAEKTGIPLSEEVKIVENYLELRQTTQLRLPEIRWTLTDNVDKTLLIPSMAILIPVENAVKYAFDWESKNQKFLLEIHLEMRNNQLYIDIIDNGIGFQSKGPKSFAEGTGNGLKILYTTIEVLNRQNSNKIAIHILNRKNEDSSLSGTHVSLIIPTDYNYKL